MDRLIALGRLLDWYGTFLTPRQAALARQYAYEDCSLSEIAEREHVSRQAVRDAIARAEAELTEMERKLRLIERSARTLEIARKLRENTEDPVVRTGLSQLIALWEDDDGV